MGLFLTATSANAAEPSPWWHIATNSRPGYIDPGSGEPGVPGAPEVQEVSMQTEEFAEFPNQAVFNLKVGGAQVKELATEPVAELGEITPATNATITSLLEGAYGHPVTVNGPTIDGSGVLSFTVEGHSGDAPISVTASEFGIGSNFNATILSPGTPGKPEVPDGVINVSAENLGNANATAGAVLTDVIPAGLAAVAVSGSKPNATADFIARESIPCSLTEEAGHQLAICTSNAPLVPFDALEMKIGVNVLGPVAEPNEATVSGGAAGSATTTRALTISSEPPPFAVDEYEMSLEEEGGAPLTHAAAHPFQFTTQIAVNQGRDIGVNGRTEVLELGLPKDVDFNLPPGLIGNPAGLARCTFAQFFTQTSGTENACPADSAVGMVNATVHEPANAGTPTVVEPLFNLEPSFGEPARFGFFVLVANTPVLIDSSIRSGNGQDYGIRGEVHNIIQNAAFLSSTATFWGVPGSPAHEHQRGWGCMLEARNAPEFSPCQPAGELHPPVLWSAPTRCDPPLATDVEINTWTDRALLDYPGAFAPSAALKGCGQVPFTPEIHSEPTSDAATSPTGLSFDIDVNDDGLQNPKGLVQSQIKKAVVTLPQGFTTNPSVAEGLKACSQAEFEAATVAEGTGCLDESKVGEVEIQSPLIPTNAEGITPKVTGGIFVARQGLNPNHNLLTLYMIARSPELGVLVRQALKVSPDPVTGQLTTEVDDIPQLPFSKFHLEFRTGQRAPLVTPSTCGTYTVTADLYPYSEPAVPLHRESSFQITQGPEGQGCPSEGVPPFHPNLLAGSENPTAGAYSPFYTEITRKDSEQEITRFSIKLPPGVIGKLAGVGSCSDAQVAAAKAREHEGGGGEEEASPSCPANSLIGHSNVGSGVGNVLAYAPGKLYLAGPYHGSNLSIVAITAARVGPFDLGTVVVRFALRIDPETAEVFVDSQGSDPIPHIVDGIPVHLRDVQATVDRPNFTLNPTSCAKKSTASTVLGSGLNFASEADDQPVTITSPFQVGSCASLGFKPRLALSLKGGTRRGATPAFKAVLTYPKGSYANIAKSVVTLPHSEFLEQGHIGTVCTRVQFKEGKVPGEKCPAASIYGKAEAVTPLLSEPLKGPVYLRSSSHQLPDLVAALHNNQVDFALDGRIDSIRNGRIRNTFETVPDAPVSKFVLEMQGGNKGLLVNSTNLCKGTNRAISEFTGQNGKLYNTNPVLSAKCGGKGKKKSKAHKGGGASR